MDFLFKNILRSIEMDNIDLDCITEDSLRLIEKHSVTHIFSYSTFIQSQTIFDESVFDAYIKPIKKTKYFLIAIDCEMMITSNGSQIGRLTMIDNCGNIIYDKYIKPECEVLDYLEEYSGLNSGNTSSGISFSSLQAEILEYIGTNTFVLGHGLENDLGALKLYTDKVIDTAYLFLSSEGYKVKLSQLSKKYFREIIQKESHSSREDAMCCLKLLAGKIHQLKKFYKSDQELIDLGVEIRSIQQLCEVELIKGRKVLHFLELDKLEDGELELISSNFVIFFYVKNGEKYLAFKQNE